MSLPNLSSPGNWLAGQRILWSVVFMLLILLQMGRIKLFWTKLKKWKLWPKYFISALLIGPQFWIFFWAPVNGETLPVALGYFAALQRTVKLKEIQEGNELLYRYIRC